MSSPSASSQMPMIHDGSGGLAKAIVGTRISTAKIGRRAEIPQFWEEGGLADRLGCCRHDFERIPRLPSSSEQKRNVQETLHEPLVTDNRRRAHRRCKGPYRRSPSF